MASDIRLNEHTIDLTDAEVQNTGAWAGYAFRDRTQPQQQRWVLYSHDGDARLYADSRGGDVVTFTRDGTVSTSGPQAGFQITHRGGPAKGKAVWYVDHDAVTLEFSGPNQDGKIVNRTAHAFRNTTGMTIYSHLRVTGSLTAQGPAQLNDGVWVGGDLTVKKNLTVGGTFSQASSAALKDDITELSGDQAIDALEELRPVTFRYKADATRHRNVGFLAEEAPELVSYEERDRLAAMDIVAVLTKVVKEQQTLLLKLSAQVDAMTRTSGSTS